MGFQLGQRARKLLRYLGIALVAIVVFVFALQMTFPYNRVKAKLVDALASKYEVTIGDVERGFIPGRVYFKAVTLRTRPTTADEVVTTFFIEKLEVDLGILPLLRGKASVDLDAKIANGHIAGNVTLSKGGVSVHVTGSNLPAANLPMRAALGLPMTGKLEFSVALDLPNGKNKMGRTAPDWTKAEGAITVACPSGCTFGDGKTKLKPLLKNHRNQIMVGDGIEFGKVTLDKLDARVEITPEVGHKPAKLVVKKFDTKSQDGELHVDYEMTLSPSFGDSIVSGCLRFNGSQSLLKREPRTYTAITTTGAELRADGLFHIKLADRFSHMKRLNQDCGEESKAGNGEDFSGHPERPNLTVQPQEQVRPIPPPRTTTPPTPTPEQEPPHDAARDDHAGSAAGSAHPPPGPVGEEPTAGSAAGEEPGSRGTEPTEGSDGTAGGAEEPQPPGEAVPGR